MNFVKSSRGTGRKSLFLLNKVQNTGQNNFSTTTVKGKGDVVILSAVRSPIGSFRSNYVSLSATQLGSQAIKVYSIPTVYTHKRKNTFDV